jgi:hypothetical protein
VCGQVRKQTRTPEKIKIEIGKSSKKEFFNMSKIAIVVLADTETHGDLGRVVNALETAKECKEAHDDVQVIFDGAGTQWVAQFAQPDHRLAGLYNSISDKVAGVCSYCANAFHVKKEEVKASGAKLLEEFEGHPSLRKLVSEGYQVITF